MPSPSFGREVRVGLSNRVEVRVPVDSSAEAGLCSSGGGAILSLNGSLRVFL